MCYLHKSADEVSVLELLQIIIKDTSSVLYKLANTIAFIYLHCTAKVFNFLLKNYKESLQNILHSMTCDSKDLIMPNI